MKRLLPALAALLLMPVPARSASLYPMEGGTLRREQHAVAPSGISNPLTLLWSKKRCGELGKPVGGPVVMADRLVQCYQKGLRCLDRANGKSIWSWNSGFQRDIFNTPTYDPDRDLLYVGFTNSEVLALRASDGHVAWYYCSPSLGNYPNRFGSVLYAGNRLFCGAGSAGLECLDPDTRAVLWRLDWADYLGDPIEQHMSCTPAYDNGLLYVPTTDGELFCVRASDGEVLWHVTQDIGSRINTVLLTDDRVFSLGDLGGVECRFRSDGSLSWQQTLTGYTNGNLALCGGILIVPGDSWRLWGLSVYDGHVCWCTKLPGNFWRSSPIAVCGKVFVSACHGDFVGLDGQTGVIEWMFHHGAELSFVDWAEADGNLYVSNSDGTIFCWIPVVPGDPSVCVCDLDPNLTLTPTPTRTPTVTPTPSTVPWCGGTLCLTGVPAENPVFYDMNVWGSPPADGGGKAWYEAGYIPGTVWKNAEIVSMPPGPWVAPCGTSGSNPGWIAPFSSGLPPNLAPFFVRNEFALPTGTTISSVNFTVSGDNEVEVWLNGTIVDYLTGPWMGDSHLYSRCATVTVDPALFHDGVNVLAFRVVNQYTYHGLTYEMCVNYTCDAGAPILTPTFTRTPTFTTSPTPTRTPSFTTTTTSTTTPTDTVTSTPTSTPTDTATATPTDTLTSTPTFTPTDTPSATPSSTPTDSPTVTPTQTPVPTSTPTPTKTPNNHCGCHSKNPVAYPNPHNGKGSMYFAMDGGIYGAVSLTVYSVSNRRLYRQTVRQAGPVEELVWNLRDDQGSLLSNGLYYAVIDMEQAGNHRRFINKILILR